MINKTSGVARTAKFPRTDYLKLNTEEVNEQVPEMSLTGFVPLQDRIIEVDEYPHLISTIKSSTPLLFADENLENDLTLDVSLHSNSLDSTSSSVELGETELNKTYTKEDLKHCLQCVSVKDLKRRAEKLENDSRSFSSNRSLQKKDKSPKSLKHNDLDDKALRSFKYAESHNKTSNNKTSKRNKIKTKESVKNFDVGLKENQICEKSKFVFTNLKTISPEKECSFAKNLCKNFLTNENQTTQKCCVSISFISNNDKTFQAGFYKDCITGNSFYFCLNLVIFTKEITLNFYYLQLNQNDEVLKHYLPKHMLISEHTKLISCGETTAQKLNELPLLPKFDDDGFQFDFHNHNHIANSILSSCNQPNKCYEEIEGLPKKENFGSCVKNKVNIVKQENTEYFSQNNKLVQDHTILSHNQSVNIELCLNGSPAKKFKSSSSSEAESLEETLLAEYKSGLFWDYYGVENIKRDTNYNESTCFQGNNSHFDSEQSSICSQNFTSLKSHTDTGSVGSIHSSRLSSSCSKDSLNLEDDCDNLIGTLCKSSEMMSEQNLLYEVDRFNYNNTPLAEGIMNNSNNCASLEEKEPANDFYLKRGYKCKKTSTYETNHPSKNKNLDNAKGCSETVLENNVCDSEINLTEINCSKKWNHSAVSLLEISKPHSSHSSLQTACDLNGNKSCYSKLPRLCKPKVISSIKNKTVENKIVGKPSLFHFDGKNDNFSNLKSNILPELPSKVLKTYTKNEITYPDRYGKLDKKCKNIRLLVENTKMECNLIKREVKHQTSCLKTDITADADLDEIKKNLTNHCLLPVVTKSVSTTSSNWSLVGNEINPYWSDANLCKSPCSDRIFVSSLKVESKETSVTYFPPIDNQFTTRIVPGQCNSKQVPLAKKKTYTKLPRIEVKRMKFPKAVKKVVTQISRKRSSNVPEPYDPYKSAAQQMLDLEPENDPPKSAPKSVTPTLVSSPTSAFTKFSSLTTPEPLFISEDDIYNCSYKEKPKSRRSSERSDSSFTAISPIINNNYSSSKESNQNALNLSSLSLCSSISIESVNSNKNGYRVGISSSAKVPEKKTPEPLRRTVSALESRKARDPFKGKLKMEDLLYGSGIDNRGERYFGSPIITGNLEKDSDDRSSSGSLHKALFNAETLNAEQELLKSVSEFEKLLTSSSTSPSPSSPSSKLFPSLFPSYHAEEEDKHEHEEKQHPGFQFNPDSAYSSLNRKSPVGGEQEDCSESCGVARFCHECGSKYPVIAAKFCCQCGVRRLII